MNHLSLILFPVETPLYLIHAAAQCLPHAFPVTHISIRKEKERQQSVTMLLRKGPSESEASVYACFHACICVCRALEVAFPAFD